LVTKIVNFSSGQRLRIHSVSVQNTIEPETIALYKEKFRLRGMLLDCFKVHIKFTDWFLAYAHDAGV